MSGRRLLVVLGNQLFPTDLLEDCRDAVVFMAEDVGLCTYVRHHQQKIVLFLAAMRSYADELRAAGFDVRYFALDTEDQRSYEDRLERVVAELGCSELLHFEVEDKPMEERLVEFCERRSIERIELQSPMFCGTREDFRDFADSRSRMLMADFYKRQRQRSGILIDGEGGPEGGKWSFDESNRKKLPKDVQPPEIAPAGHTDHVEDVIAIVERHFADHPGRAAEFWWPTTREQARAWLSGFLDERLAQFGPYEDAISKRSATVFHSALSPSLNLGLLTPREVLDAVLQRYETQDLPIESIEGFVRQVLGWREFVRGIYRVYGDEQESRNFWGHEREMSGARPGAELDPCGAGPAAAGGAAPAAACRRRAVVIRAARGDRQRKGGERVESKLLHESLRVHRRHAGSGGNAASTASTSTSCPSEGFTVIVASAGTPSFSKMTSRRSKDSVTAGVKRVSCSPKNKSTRPWFAIKAAES